MGVTLKVLVAMETKLCNQSTFAIVWNSYRVSEISILYTSANFEKLDTNNLKQMNFLNHSIRRCKCLVESHTS